MPVTVDFNTFKTREFKGHKDKVHTVGWSLDGRKLASGSVDKTVRIWHPERSMDGRSVSELKGHTDSVDQLAWSPTDPHLLATASCDKTVRIWDSRTSKTEQKLTTSGENINLCWRPDASTIAVGNKDDAVTFIETRNFRVLHTIPNDIEINEICWNWSGDLFFMTTGQGTIKIYDYLAMADLYTLYAHTSNCYCLEIDPTGRFLATGSADAIIGLWDLEEFVCLRTFTQLNWPVRTISFSYDGQYLVSGSEDLVIYISDVETGEVVHKIPCTAAMNTVAWHPSKYYLAYAGDEVDSKGIMAGNLRVFGI